MIVLLLLQDMLDGIISPADRSSPRYYSSKELRRTSSGRSTSTLGYESGSVLGRKSMDSTRELLPTTSARSVAGEDMAALGGVNDNGSSGNNSIQHTDGRQVVAGERTAVLPDDVAIASTSAHSASNYHTRSDPIASIRSSQSLEGPFPSASSSLGRLEQPASSFSAQTGANAFHPAPSRLRQSSSMQQSNGAPTRLPGSAAADSTATAASTYGHSLPGNTGAAASGEPDTANGLSRVQQQQASAYQCPHEGFRAVPDSCFAAEPNDMPAPLTQASTDVGGPASRTPGSFSFGVPVEGITPSHSSGPMPCMPSPAGFSAEPHTNHHSEGFSAEPDTHHHSDYQQGSGSLDGRGGSGDEVGGSHDFGRMPTLALASSAGSSISSGGDKEAGRDGSLGTCLSTVLEMTESAEANASCSMLGASTVGTSKQQGTQYRPADLGLGTSVSNASNGVDATASSQILLHPRGAECAASTTQLTPATALLHTLGRINGRVTLAEDSHLAPACSRALSASGATASFHVPRSGRSMSTNHRSLSASSSLPPAAPAAFKQLYLGANGQSRTHSATNQSSQDADLYQSPFIRTSLNNQSAMQRRKTLEQQIYNQLMLQRGATAERYGFARPCVM